MRGETRLRWPIHFRIAAGRSYSKIAPGFRGIAIIRKIRLQFAAIAYGFPNCLLNDAILVLNFIRGDPVRRTRNLSMGTE